MARRTYWKSAPTSGGRFHAHYRRKLEDGAIIHNKRFLTYDEVTVFIKDQNLIVRSCKDSEEYESLLNTISTLMK